MGYVDTPTFGVVDYCVFAALLIISLLIGVYASFKGNKTPEEFLMGNRGFGPVPIAMSLLTSFVSSISLLGYSGEAYAYGIQMFLFVIGIGIGVIIASFVAVPVIFPLRLTSINEYLELRFHSVPLRKTIVVIGFVRDLMFMGTCLYAPTLALASVTSLSSLTYIFILGAVVTIYSSMGGIRAVVWTDVFQLSVMMIGLVVIVIIGFFHVGGVDEVWAAGIEGGRLTTFSASLSVLERHTVFNTVAFGIFLYSALYGVSQVNTQRLCSVRTIKDAYRILAINVFGLFIIYVLIFMSGLTVYAAYAECDPWVRGIIQKKEEIIPFFIVDRLHFVFGLPGLFVATLIGGTLSSLSSVINAEVAILWKDILSGMKVFANVKPITATIINKIFSLVIGCTIIGTAVVASQAENLIQFSLSITGIMFGGIYGVFLMGLLLPKTNLKGVWAGLIVSIIIVGFISGGSFFFGKSTSPLSFSVMNCSHLPSFNISDISENFQVFSESEVVKIVKEPDESPFMQIFYVSYTLYSVIGTTCCIFVGVIVSLLTGNRDIKTVAPNLVSPFMRKLYWTEKELEKFYNDESNKRLMEC